MARIEKKHLVAILLCTNQTKPDPGTISFPEAGWTM